MEIRIPPDEQLETLKRFFAPQDVKRGIARFDALCCAVHQGILLWDTFCTGDKGEVIQSFAGVFFFVQREDVTIQR